MYIFLSSEIVSPGCGNEIQIKRMETIEKLIIFMCNFRRNMLSSKFGLGTTRIYTFKKSILTVYAVRSKGLDFQLGVETVTQRSGTEISIIFRTETGTCKIGPLLSANTLKKKKKLFYLFVGLRSNRHMFTKGVSL